MRLDNLCHYYGGLLAVNQVSLGIEQKELRVIIGPNGAGKTTLFNLISGLLRPSSGRIYLFGQDITGMSCRRRSCLGLGRTFQITSLFPGLTVLQNVLMALQAQKRLKFVMYRSQESCHFLLHGAEEALRRQQLWEKHGTLVRNLSYGEQRKLEIILTLLVEPKLLLLDEPAAGLSSAETKTLVAMIRTLSQSTTVLMIEHDMEVAFGLAQRITVLHEGRIFADGAPDDIKSDPRVREIYLGEEELDIA